jgi:hypothetical protein
VGADAGKTHQSYTVTPAPPPRPGDAVDVRDDSPAGSTPLTIDADALDAAIAAAGVTVSANTVIKLRLRPQTQPGQQGSTRRLGADQYRIVIHVAPKPAFADAHLYVINNSLLHELRHVAQMQQDPDHAAHYAHQNLTVGYASNKYEIEARHWGRLADHTGSKDTGPAGAHLGKQVWALRAL